MDDLNSLRPARPGYRLHRLEAYNWGTFDSTAGQVYTVQPEGRTTLLVGQNGSGKSTLVDAVLTLLVPPGIRNYNVAAGAKKTERSERSYVRGACGRGSDADQVAVTKYLRPGAGHYSALLAVFSDEHLDRSFTLCQVLHQTADGAIDKTYALADEPRRLAEDLSGIERADQVRGRLKDCGYRTTKKYVEYNQWLARRTGIRGKAMDMFNQTVAVKDIQSLNDFIRHHMLESHDWREKVQRLLAHFAELSTAHRELVRVRQAQEMLEPIEQVGAKYQRESEKLMRAERMLSAADTYFRAQTLRLYEPELAKYREKQAEAVDSKTRLTMRMSVLSEDIRRLKNEIEQAGGERMRTIPLLIEREQAALDPKRREFSRFQDALARCGIRESATNNDRFQTIQDQLRRRAKEAGDKAGKLMTRHEDLVIQRGQIHSELRTEREELETLQRRQTNLPGYLATVRLRLCEDLRLAEYEVPFAAELIAVRSEERAWESSAEMVLRPFALSLLVPDRYYRRVRHHVETTRMVDGQGKGQKLVYLRVDRAGIDADSGDRQHPQSLVRKLDFRPGHDLAPWVRGQVERRFAYQCCESPEEFDDAPRLAMTANRHVKVFSDRHEKDDRPGSVDPRNFVLGWDNREKKQALARRVAELQQQIVALDGQISAIASQLDECRQIVEAASTALRTSDFDAIDVNRHLEAITSLEAERAELENSDDTIQVLRGRLQTVEQDNLRVQSDRDDAVTLERELQKSIAVGENLIRNAHKRLEDLRIGGSYEADVAAFDELDEQFADPPLTIETLFMREQEFVTRTGRSIAQLREKVDPIGQNLVSLMSRYLRDFKVEAEDLDARTDSLPSFLALLHHIRSEDLPRHEKRFKDRLNDKVSQEVALFHAELRKESKQIEEKIALLNQSLGELEYQSGTFMRLEPRPVTDREIKDFQLSLRACLEDSLENSDEANEARFLRIEHLVNRLADTEKTRWRDKVIDVRRWYDFAAREVDRETGETHSYYEDSSGQSGGEKAKLAFTILVAAIAYQYDLDPLAQTAGRFHFVCVDEMFSKVDDRYAEYAMRLFEQFGLQLLIVAPLDAKARVTEPFVDCYLHVVKDETTRRSQIFSMTAREYETVVGGFAGGGAPARGRGRKLKAVPK